MTRVVVYLGEVGVPRVWARDTAKRLWHITTATYPDSADVLCTSERLTMGVFATDPALGRELRPELCAQCISKALGTDPN